MTALLHDFAASAFRPASLIFSVATSILRPPGNDALGGRGREPGADKLDHLLDREAVSAHNRFCASVAARSEQFERAALVGLGAKRSPPQCHRRGLVLVTEPVSARATVGGIRESPCALPTPKNCRAPFHKVNEGKDRLPVLLALRAVQVKTRPKVGAFVIGIMTRSSLISDAWMILLQASRKERTSNFLLCFVQLGYSLPQLVFIGGP